MKIQSYLVSVIVINFNNVNGLKNTFISLENQSYKNSEIIYIDGGSTDGSLKIADEYCHIINQKVIGEDSGIYNAMNIGIKFATGKYLMFLNSGDFLTSSEVFSYFNEEVNTKNQNHLFFGYSEIVSEKSTWLFPPLYVTSDIYILKSWLKNHEPTHQAMFFPRDFCKQNEYDETFKIISDKHYKNLALKNLDYTFIDKVIVSFQIGGISSYIKSFKHLLVYINDFKLLYLKYNKNIKGFIIFIQESFKLILKFILQRYMKNHFWHILKLLKGYS